MDWNKLKKYTEARIGIQTSGIFPSTQSSLQFTFAHARAQDAVQSSWNLAQQMLDTNQLGLKTFELLSQARTRQEYLLNPDLGRSLLLESEKNLNKLNSIKNSEIIFFISNGLSSQSMHDHLIGFLKELKLNFALDENSPPLFFVENARVGLSNRIGEILKPKILVCIVGERPGLTSSNSLGLYLTFKPTMLSNDSDRNCISNIRPPNGQSYQEAIQRLKYLINEALRTQRSGTLLKDESDTKLISK